MSKKARYGFVLFVFLIYSVYDWGGGSFTNGLYSPLVYFLCYIFLAAFTLKGINAMSLYRYGSAKALYYSYMKRQLAFAVIYMMVFFMFGMMSRFLAGFIGGKALVSERALLKFIVFNTINLSILTYVQLLTRMAFGKVISMLLTCSCVFLSVINTMCRVRFINPFMFNTAYMRWKDIKSYRVVMSYVMCAGILVLATYLLRKNKDVQL